MIAETSSTRRARLVVRPAPAHQRGPRRARPSWGFYYDATQEGRDDAIAESRDKVIADLDALGPDHDTDDTEANEASET